MMMMMTNSQSMVRVCRRACVCGCVC